jgi:hypothetical protein
VHLSPKGQIFMAGPLAQSLFLDVKDDKGVDIKDNAGVVGTWTDAKTARGALFRDYAPSVMYDKGKIIYMGGGTEIDDEAPTSRAEIIDLNEDKPKWKDTANMSIARKQFNATVLPDGTVLVTGGFSGGGFNNLATAVHKAETEMAAESFNRCYHSIALLLPDGRVLSAGGGEYGGVGDRPVPYRRATVRATLPVQGNPANHRQRAVRDQLRHDISSHRRHQRRDQDSKLGAARFRHALSQHEPIIHVPPQRQQADWLEAHGASSCQREPRTARSLHALRVERKGCAVRGPHHPHPTSTSKKHQHQHQHQPAQPDRPHVWRILRSTQP